MTVRDLTNALYEAGEGKNEVVFTVRGSVKGSEYLEPRDAGYYETKIDVDMTADIDEISQTNNVVKVVLWI